MNKYQREIDCLKRTVTSIYTAQSVIKEDEQHSKEFMKGWETAHDFILKGLISIVDILELYKDEEDTDGRA